MVDLNFTGATALDFTRPGGGTRTILPLTNGVPKTLVVASIADKVGRGGKIDFVVFDGDGTSAQVMAGTITWAAVNKAGVMSGEAQAVAETPAVGSNAGTIDVAASLDLSTPGRVGVQVTVTSSLTPTGFTVSFVASDTTADPITPPS